MTARALSATEALLSQAAAETAEEVHASRLALIRTGGGATRELDDALLVTGAGTAGNGLLGGPRTRAGWRPKASAAIRSYALLRRFEEQQTDGEAPSW